LMLLKKFKSAKRVSEASFEEHKELVGASKAQKLIGFFGKKDEEK